MRSSRNFRGFLALLAAAAMALPANLLGAGAPAVAAERTTASLQGTVLASPPSRGDAPASPVAGAVIEATEVASGHSFHSTASDAAGSYRVAGLPPGSYAVSIHTPAGVFLSDGIVGVEAGQDRRLSFALQQGSPREAGGTEAGDEPPPGGQKGQGEGQGDKEKPKPPEPPAKPTGFWATHPWLAGGAVAGTAIALGLLADSLTEEETQKQEEHQASPSSP